MARLQDRGPKAPVMLYSANFPLPDHLASKVADLSLIVAMNFGTPEVDWVGSPSKRTFIQRMYAEALFCWFSLSPNDKTYQPLNLTREPAPVWTVISPEVIARHPVADIVRKQWLIVIDDSLPTAGYFRHAATELELLLSRKEDL